MPRLIRCPKSPALVWESLLGVEQQCRWWGRPDAALIGVGQQFTVKTDEDWQTVWVEGIAEQRSLQLTVAVFGIDPVYRVALSLHPQIAGGVHIRITVSGLPTAAAVAREDVWATRILEAVSDAEQSPAWSAPIETSALLSRDTWPPLHAANRDRWLPISMDTEGNCDFFTVDEDGPRAWRVRGLHAHYDEQLRVTFDDPVGANAVIRVEIDPVARLTVRHDGWFPGAQPPAEHRLLVRSRFAAAWRAAVRDAQRLSDGGRSERQ